MLIKPVVVDNDDDYDDDDDDDNMNESIIFLELYDALFNMMHATTISYFILEKCVL